MFRGFFVEIFSTKVKRADSKEHAFLKSYVYNSIVEKVVKSGFLAIF